MTLFLAEKPSHKLEKDSFSRNIELFFVHVGPAIFRGFTFFSELATSTGLQLANFSSPHGHTNCSNLEMEPKYLTKSHVQLKLNA